MPKQFRCARGHQWAGSADPLFAETTIPGRCPVCGAAGETHPDAGPAPEKANALPPTSAELPGIPGYEVLAWLGEGAMGRVYKARHLRLDRVVALKVIHPDRLAQPEYLRRFQREARAAARLAHPNVVAVHDAGEANGVHFLTMEYVEGADLGRLVRDRGPLPVAQACEYVRQAALGLQHAHERGLVHRDLKPANLLVTADGALVKILDLGLARLCPPDKPGEPPSMLTQLGQPMGTPAFLAPEQAVDAARADVRADIYSLGCTLYYLLTGRPPFTGAGAMDVLLKHQTEQPQPLTSVRPGVPAGLQAVLSRTLAKRPEDRYQTPAELAAALQPFSRAAPPPRETGGPAPAGEARPRTGERRRLYLLAVVVVVVALGGLAGRMGHWGWPKASNDGGEPAQSQDARQQATVAQAAEESDRGGERSDDLDPDDAKQAVIWNNRGYAHFKKKEYAEAIEAYTRAVRLNPKFTVAYNNRGLARAARGDHETAIQDYDEAIRLNPKYGLAYLNRGDSYYERKQYGRAVEDYGEAVKLHPKDAVAHNNRGLARAAAGGHEAAIADSSRAVELDPDFALAYLNRGVAYRKMGDAKRAEADRRKAVSLDPSLAK